MGLEGEGDCRACGTSSGGPGIPAGARCCLSLESSRPPGVTLAGPHRLPLGAAESEHWALPIAQ